MRSLWFIVPAHARVELARVCLRQLARTCRALWVFGIDANAVVIADDENLETARELGFATVERENHLLGVKFNDGYELAGREQVDYMVPLGTDDWVTAEWVAGALPDENEIRCSRLMCMVDETGSRIAELEIPYVAGHGIRVIPRQLLEPLGFRPAGEDRRRAIDVSVLDRISSAHGGRPNLVYHDVVATDVVDWKSPGEQLNTYDMCARYVVAEVADPFSALAGLYPAESLDEMRAVYQGVPA